MISKTQRRYNVSIWSKNLIVVTMSYFGRSNNVGNTTLWQRCFDVAQRRDEKVTKTQRLVC